MMELKIKKCIKDGQFMVEIRASLTVGEQALIKKHGDIVIDLSSFKSRKSFCKLSDFSASGSFTNENGAKTFIDRVSKRLKEILKAYRGMPGEFAATEVQNIEGLKLKVVGEMRNHNYYLHLSTQPNDKNRGLIEKYGNQDIDVSTDKFTSHAQPFHPQSSKILSLRVNKTFENAVDAYEYIDKIKAEIKQVLKDYANRKDTFSGEERAEI